LPVEFPSNIGQVKTRSRGVLLSLPFRGGEVSLQGASPSGVFRDSGQSDVSGCFWRESGHACPPGMVGRGAYLLRDAWDRPFTVWVLFLFLQPPNNLAAVTFAGGEIRAPRYFTAGSFRNRGQSGVSDCFRRVRACVSTGDGGALADICSAMLGTDLFKVWVLYLFYSRPTTWRRTLNQRIKKTRI
jgi:hypothetical protein